MIQCGSIAFIWVGLLDWIARHQEMIKEKLRDPEYDENVVPQKLFGISFGAIVRNFMYAFLIACAIYTSYTLGAFVEF